MADIEVDGYYQKQAKELIELLYDKHFLNDDLALESIEWLTDFVGFIIQSQCQTAAKVALLQARLRDNHRGTRV